MQGFKKSVGAKIAQVQKGRELYKKTTASKMKTVERAMKEYNLQKLYILRSNKRIAKLFGTTEECSAVQLLQ